MEWLMLLAAAGVSAWSARRLRSGQSHRKERREELEAVRRLADEDVTVFGEELQRLDEVVGERPLDPDGRADYQRALDAYESATRAVPRMRDADEVSTVTDTLSTGRYALACVHARIAGAHLPQLRTPCFFNPQHGPSTTDVEWTTSRYGTRTVPACAQDAARVAAHQRPEVRTVTIGARTVPYWEAGAAFLPYSRGYFVAAVPVDGAPVDWALTAADTGWFGDTGHGAGSHGGPDGGFGFNGGDGGGGGGDG